jgi:hypothetical protein
VPWCATCDRFLSPSTVTTEGSCPRCGAAVDPGRASPAPDAGGDDLDSDPGGETTGKRRREIPWHVKALLGVFAIYLGYRAFQGLEWLVKQL